MTVLVDTSALLAYAFARDSNHAAASGAVRASAGDSRIVPAPVLTELFYLTMARLNYERAIQVFRSTRAAFEIVALTDW